MTLFLVFIYLWVPLAHTALAGVTYNPRLLSEASFFIGMAKQNVPISPLGDRVVVKPADKNEEKQLASGIIIPETVDKERPSKGVVVAVGPGKYDDGVLVPMTVSVGDTVLFSKYGYDEVKIDGVEYYILAESNVLATLTS